MRGISTDLFLQNNKYEEFQLMSSPKQSVRIEEFCKTLKEILCSLILGEILLNFLKALNIQLTL
jgi:hypothetical protein